MRLMVVIMTGIGFTLGLLCGLLLQLPADANTDHAIVNSHNIRFRRNFNDGEVLADGGDQQRQFAGGVNGGGVDYSLGEKSSVEAVHNPHIGSKPVLSSVPDEGTLYRQPQLRPGAAGQGGSQAEQIGSSVKTEQGRGEGEERGDNPPPPAHPVTSFTLRLKNTGGKFVVDSAVKNGNSEQDSGKAAGDQRDSPVRQGNNREVSSNSLKVTDDLKNIISSGVLWSRKVEDACPRGLERAEVSAWRRKAGGMQVVKMEEGCGRMQNRLLTFKDGSQACARYRLNTDQIQGEVYSYYLAQFLNITDNLPPAILLPVDTLSPQWKSVHLEMSMAQWADGRLVVLTRWLDHLSPSHIPQELREDDRKLHPTSDILDKKTVQELCDLLQWSDLIVFDYLTANLDRMVNNMFNRQWNAEMMNNPAHNLERTESGRLVFLDNESGLFHGYRLLEKYHSYHESLLNSLCVFRDSTAKAVKRLHRSRNVGEELQKLFSEGEVHHRQLPAIPEKNANILQDRLDRVYEQIVRCEALYGQR